MHDPSATVSGSRLAARGPAFESSRFDAARARDRLQLAPHRHAGDRQAPAVVRLHQHADGPFVLPAGVTRRDDVPMPPFQPNATVPVPAPTAPSSTAPLVRAVDRRRDVLARARAGRGCRSAPPSLVSPTSALTERTFSLPGCASVQRTTASSAAPTRERVRQHDRRLDRAELLDLRRAGELAERVADEDRAGHLLAEQIAAVRQDRRDAGAHGIAARRA